MIDFKILVELMTENDRILFDFVRNDGLSQFSDRDIITHVDTRCERRTERNDTWRDVRVGRRSTIGNRVGGKPSQGFESPSLRHVAV